MRIQLLRPPGGATNLSMFGCATFPALRNIIEAQSQPALHSVRNMLKNLKEPKKTTFHPLESKKSFDLRDLVKKIPTASPPALTPKTCGSTKVPERPPKRSPAPNPSIAPDKKLKIAPLNILIDDLRFFDVTTIHRRSDPKAKMLADKINDTLADIFGRNSPEYEDNSVWSFDTLPITIGGSWYPLPEVREAYRRGLNSTIAKLTKLIDGLEKDRKKTEGQRRSDDTAANTASVQAGKEKISLISIREKLREQKAFSFQHQGSDVTEPPSQPCPPEKTTHFRRHDTGHIADLPGGGEAVSKEISHRPKMSISPEPIEQPPVGITTADPTPYDSAPAQIAGNDSIALSDKDTRHTGQSSPDGAPTKKTTDKRNPGDYPATIPEAQKPLTSRLGPNQTPEKEPALPLSDTDHESACDRISLDTLEKRLLAFEEQVPVQPDTSQAEVQISDNGTTLDELLGKLRDLDFAKPTHERLGNNPATLDKEHVLRNGTSPERGCESLTPVIAEIGFREPTPLSSNVPGDTVSVADYVDGAISEALIIGRSQRTSREPGAETDNLPLTAESFKHPQTVTPLPWANVDLDELVLPDCLGYALESCHTHGLMAVEPYFCLLFQQNEAPFSCLPHSEEHHDNIPQLAFNIDKLLSDVDSPETLGLLTADAAPGLIPGEAAESNEGFAKIIDDEHGDLPDSIDSKLHYAHGFDAVPPPHESLYYFPLIVLPDDIHSGLQTNAILLDISEAGPIFPGSAALQTSFGFPPSPNHLLHKTSGPHEMQSPEPDMVSLKFVDTKVTTIAADEVLLQDAEFPSILSEHMEEIPACYDGFTTDLLELFVGGFEESAIFLNDTGFHQPMTIDNSLRKKESSTADGQKPVIETKPPMVFMEGALTEASTNASFGRLCEALQAAAQATDQPDQETNQAVHDATRDLAPCAQGPESVGTPETEIPLSDPFRKNISAEPCKGVRAEQKNGQLQSQTDDRLSEPESEDQINQNPFATPNLQKHKSEEKKIRLEVQDAHIVNLTGRIEDLASFDIKTIKDRFDPRIKELGDAVNGALADIFGQNTPAYWQHAIPSLDTLPAVVGGPRLSPHEIREVYKKGIDDATVKLRSVLEILERKRGKHLTPGSESMWSGTQPIPEVKTHSVQPPNSRSLFKEPLRPLVRHASAQGQGIPRSFTSPNLQKHKSEEKKIRLEVQDAHIVNLTGRIEDLASFDIKTIKDRFDPRIKELGDAVNGALADIFGQNTPAYWQHAIPSLDTLPAVVGGPRLSPHEIREVYKKGIDDATVKLRSVLEILERKRGKHLTPGSESTNSLDHKVHIRSKEMTGIPSFPSHSH